MKKIVLSLIVIASVLSCTKAEKTEFTPTALQSELIATDKSTTTFQEVIDANKGKIIFLDMWASWCSDCIKGMPKLKELQQQHPDIEYVYISLDKAHDKWSAGIEKHELEGQHFWATDGMKGVFGTAIELDWIPRYMIIDQQGKIALYKAIEADDAQINSVLEELKANNNEK